MGLFKKSVVEVENDDEIRREIRARVAKQAGMYDEEYIQTGKIGGRTEDVADLAEIAFGPTEAEPVEPKPAKEPKPPKEPKPAKEPKPPKEKKQKQPNKKKHNIALILFIIVLLLAFIPLYYYITGMDRHPDLTITSTANTLMLQDPMLVRGTVYDSGSTSGVKLYYSLDQGSAVLFYTFETKPGPFEDEITLPTTADFVGDHTISFYAKDGDGSISQPVVQNFTVVNLP